MMLVATLTVKPGKLEQFRDYEGRAARLMERHGGRIERTVALWENNEDDFYREIHVVFFPTPEALAAYREDPDFLALGELRESCIAATTIKSGEPGPNYHLLG
jgi:uncharacterized protein (DUF1330 family)